MSRDALKTLFHPFATDVIAAPGADARILFLGAEAGFQRPQGFDASIACVQGFRPLYNALQRQAGVTVTPEIEGEDYDGALILCGKHRGANEAWLATALERVVPGGMIVLAGGKEDGVQPLRKRLAALGYAPEHMPKYHGVAVWFARPEDISGALKIFSSSPVSVEGRFRAAPGMFSHDRVDGGSELLASRLPTDFDGLAADFAAGWGYLSVALADKSPATKRIDLFEADHASLEAAKANLAANCPRLATRFFWQDLAGEAVKEKYDLVIMNPPFHEGHAADPLLGQTLIKAAAGALRSGGRLMLVANRGLPYEDVMAASFRQFGETCRNARYKVLWGAR
ncbi:class I SAM-dependent methyltransferase [Rhizobium sp. PAMB 3182]